METMEEEMSGKKSFLVYFDAYPCLEGLNMEQRGQLFTALFRYAIDAAKGELSPQDALDRLHGLSPETRIAFLFLASTVCRDTAAWRKKKANCSQAAQRRNSRSQAAQRRNSRSQAAQSAPKPAGCGQEQDIWWMGKYIRQRDAAHPPKDGSGPPRPCLPPEEPAGDEERPDR